MRKQKSTSSPPPCFGNISENLISPIFFLDMSKLDVVPHVVHLRSSGISKNVRMPLAQIPFVNELTGTGNLVGPTYPDASGVFSMAVT